MTAWFTESPTWAYLVLSILAVAFLTAFFTTKRVIYLGSAGGMLVLALGFWLIHIAVETDREQVIRKTAEFADYTQTGQLDKFSNLISARFYMDRFPNKEALMDRARRFIPPGQPRTVEFWNIDAKPSANQRIIVATCNAKAEGTFGNFQAPGTWLGMVELTFVKDEDGQWRVNKFSVSDIRGDPVTIPS